MINTKSIRWIMVVVVMLSSIAASAEERIVWQQGVDYIEVKELPSNPKKVTFAPHGATPPPFQAAVASGGDSPPNNFLKKVFWI